MNEENIFKRIQDEVEEFRTKEVLIVDTYKFNQLRTVEQNIRLYNSQFKAGTQDSEGFRKYFYNIVRNPCTVAEKAISFDTSDIQVVSAPGHNYRKAWIADRDFRQWVKSKDFGSLLAGVFHETPIQGTSVIKKVKGKYAPVDIRNLINEQSADSLERASYVIEQHYLTPDELRQGPWDKEKIAEVLEVWQDTKMPFIRVFERYGYVRENELRADGDPNKIVRSVFLAYSPEKDVYDRFGTAILGVELHSAEIKPEDFPYREFHWERIPGRWLGVGRVEINADPQVRTNEIVNLRVKASYFAALNVWQTRDTTIPKNLVRHIANGDVLQVMNEITRIPTEERNLSSFATEENRWMQNRDEQSMSFDVIRGERLPAGTPLGSAQLAAQMTTSYFDLIKKEIARSLKKFIYRDVFQSFLKDQSNEHYVKLVGEDLDQWNQLMVQEHMNVEILKFVAKNRKIPTKVQEEATRAAVSERIRQGTEVSELLPKDFYKDAQYEIDIVITEEARKMAARAANMTTILQAIQQDPALLTDPGKRKLFRQLTDSVGVSIADIEPNEAAQIPSMGESLGQAAKGGGISAPRDIVQAPEPQMI